MIETGRRSISDICALRRIARALGLPTHVLGVTDGGADRENLPNRARRTAAEHGGQMVQHRSTSPSGLWVTAAPSSSRTPTTLASSFRWVR
jgi:hypothetical protein